MVRNNAHIWVCVGAFLTLITAPTIVQSNEHNQPQTHPQQTKNASQEAANAEAEIFNLLNSCFDDKQDTRPFCVFIEEIIAHLQKHKEYFKAKYSSIDIDQLINSLQSIQHCKSPNKIGITLKNYKCLLPDNLEKLTILAMRKKIADRLIFK